MRAALLILTFIFIAMFSRLVPHPPNFTALNAIALTGVLSFGSCWAAFFVVAASMLFTDLVIGLHPMISFVYLSFGLIAFSGKWLQKNSTLLGLVSLSLFSSLLFFVVTNFGEWSMGSLYPKTGVGLLACYTAALPFFANQLFGDLAYSALIFYGYQLFQNENMSVYLERFLLKK